MRSAIRPLATAPNIAPIVIIEPKNEYSAKERPKSIKIPDSAGDEYPTAVPNTYDPQTATNVLNTTTAVAEPPVSGSMQLMTRVIGFS